MMGVHLVISLGSHYDGCPFSDLYLPEGFTIGRRFSSSRVLAPYMIISPSISQILRITLLPSLLNSILT